MAGQTDSLTGGNRGVKNRPLSCALLLQKYLTIGPDWPRASEFHFGKRSGYGVYPPHPSESRDWRGVCKNGLQNLEPQGFRGQDLENKRATALFAVAAATATVSTMICFLNSRVKVGCHKPGCGKDAFTFSRIARHRLPEFWRLCRPRLAFSIQHAREFREVVRRGAALRGTP